MPLRSVPCVILAVLTEHEDPSPVLFTPGRGGREQGKYPMGGAKKDLPPSGSPVGISGQAWIMP